MIAPRLLDDGVLVSGQIDLDDVEAFKALGVTTVVNNRPEGESPDQPSEAETRSAVEAAGLHYVAAPVAGMPDAAAVSAVASALDRREPSESVLLYCKSGMRSTVAWALARRAAGDDPQTLRDRAADAGYDLSRLPL